LIISQQFAPCGTIAYSSAWTTSSWLRLS
jgi:hypothetical protein